MGNDAENLVIYNNFWSVNVSWKDSQKNYMIFYWILLIKSFVPNVKRHQVYVLYTHSTMMSCIQLMFVQWKANKGSLIVSIYLSIYIRRNISQQPINLDLDRVSCQQTNPYRERESLLISYTVLISFSESVSFSAGCLFATKKHYLTSSCWDFRDWIIN